MLALFIYRLDRDKGVLFQRAGAKRRPAACGVVFDRRLKSEKRAPEPKRQTLKQGFLLNGGVACRHGVATSTATAAPPRHGRPAGQACPPADEVGCSCCYCNARGPSHAAWDGVCNSRPSAAAASPSSRHCNPAEQTAPSCDACSQCLASRRVGFARGGSDCDFASAACGRTEGLGEAC